jgi:thioredoxin-like negative regulator of GroEL
MDHRETLLRNVGSADFTSTVLMSDKPVLVDFTAAWCVRSRRSSNRSRRTTRTE